jgi:hypothetical protein
MISGAILFVPATAVAQKYSKVAIPFTNVIYNISSEEDTISVFDDGDNKCYLATARISGYSDGNLTSISCVKR